MNFSPKYVKFKTFRYFGSCYQKLRDYFLKIKCIILHESFPLTMIRLPGRVTCYIKITPMEWNTNPDGLFQLEPLRGYKRAISIAIHATCAIRILYGIFTLTPFLFRLQLLHKGSFTLDACLLASNILVVASMVAIIVISRVHGLELRESVNFCNQISKDIAERCYGRPNLLLVHSREPVLVALAALMTLGVVIVPPTAMLDMLLARFSPQGLLHEVAEVSEDGDPFLNLQNPLVWLVGWIDWMALVLGFYLVLSTATFFFEMGLQVILVLRNIRQHGMATWPCEDINKYLMQLELLMARKNICAREFLPLALVADYSVAILSAVMVLRMQEKLLPNVSMGVVFYSFVVLHMAAVLVGYAIFRSAEILACESKETLKQFSLRLLKSQRKNFRAHHPQLMLAGEGFSEYGSMYRGPKSRIRNPLRVRIWSFKAIEESMALEYLQSIVDNVVTGSFMIDVTIPMKIFRYPYGKGA